MKKNSLFVAFVLGIVHLARQGGFLVTPGVSKPLNFENRNDCWLS